MSRLRVSHQQRLFFALISHAVLDGNAFSMENPAAISLAPDVVGCRRRLPLPQKNGKDKDSGFQVLLLAYGLLTGPNIA
jgi:hypothetical protein